MSSVSRMLAWRVHAYGPRGAGEMRLERARVPQLRKPDDVLVKVHATSYNPIDLLMIHGYGASIFNRQRASNGIDEFPLVLGCDWVGEVVAAGPEARLRPGDRAWGVAPPYSVGSLAQYVLVKDNWATPAPRTLDDLSAGGALYAALTACAALRAAGLPPGKEATGKRVFLLGVGGVGQAALQILAHAGAEVVVGCSQDVCERALALGAHAALDRRAPDYDKLIEECGPYAAVLDTAGLGGGEASRRRWQFARYVTLTAPLLESLDNRGLVLGGLTALATLISQTVALYIPPYAPRASTANIPRASWFPHVRWAFFAPTGGDIEMLRRLADAGKFKVDVEKVFPWWDGNRAFERGAKGNLRGKIVIDWTAEPPADRLNDLPSD